MAIQMPPIPLVEGYQLNPVDPIIRSEVESGPPRARRTFYARNDKINVSWSMTDATYASFRAWFDSDEGAGGGASWFSMALPIGEYGFRTVEARFASIWQSAPSGTLRWKVTATLELRYPELSTVEKQNLLLGLPDKDVVLLWYPTTQAGVLTSKIGPDAEFAVAGAQYDESGTSLGTVAALHSKGVWVGPAYSNLFTGSVAEQTKTLTAQKYTVWCDAGSVVCGSYGTATAAAPLTFTATAGDCTFTPSGVTRWMLTASVAPMPYVAPGVSVASAAGSTTNGLDWTMSDEMTAALSGACTVAALVTMGVSNTDLPTALTTPIPICSVRNKTDDVLISRGRSDGAQTIVRSNDGTTAAAINATWSRNEQHLKVVQTNATASQFRVGNQRIGIDSAIQWGSWATYDGSFNPLTYLRAAYGNTVPMWVKAVMLSKAGDLTEAQILERLNA